jgi:hypothetical protein
VGVFPLLSACAASLSLDNDGVDKGEHETGEFVADSGADTDSGVDDTGSDGDTAADADWTTFVDSREGWLVQLGEPILLCTVAEDDSRWPVFHGCYDWHSAVHGVYALHALSRMTGDPFYLDQADELLTPVGIEAELAGLQAGRLSAEVPYGFAWFLALAVEREVATGQVDLAPMAVVVADDLEDWVERLSDRAAEAAVYADDYQNLSWALLNLHRYALHEGDAARAARMEAQVRESVLPAECPLPDDADAPEFFPPCLHRALAIVDVLPPDEAALWVETLPEALDLAPRTEFASAHQGGANFSRSWGLWALWAASGEVQYRTSYADHIQTHMRMPQYWAQDYASYAHWVPQFGVFGLAEGWEE